MKKMPPHGLQGSTPDFVFLFGGTRAEKGLKPLLHQSILHAIVVVVIVYVMHL